MPGPPAGGGRCSPRSGGRGRGRGGLGAGAGAAASKGEGPGTPPKLPQGRGRQTVRRTGNKQLYRQYFFVLIFFMHNNSFIQIGPPQD